MQVLDASELDETHPAILFMRKLHEKHLDRGRGGGDSSSDSDDDDDDDDSPVEEEKCVSRLPICVSLFSTLLFFSHLTISLRPQYGLRLMGKDAPLQKKEEDDKNRDRDRDRDRKDRDRDRDDRKSSKKKHRSRSRSRTPEKKKKVRAVTAVTVFFFG